MVAVTVGSKSKYTSTKKDVTPASQVYWGEHLFFERNNMVTIDGSFITPLAV
jgi:hypothetical protein